MQEALYGAATIGFVAGIALTLFAMWFLSKRR
jgi:hypothetical protein